MQIYPLIYLADYFCRCLSVNYTIQNTDTTFIISIRKMYMGRIMVFPIQTNYNSIKTANLRHSVGYYILRCKDTTNFAHTQTFGHFF